MGIAGGPNDLAGLDGTVDAETGTGLSPDEATFEVCNSMEELRVALAWVEAEGDALINDLDLELESPSGKIFYGNYFTDDDNRDGELDLNTEDCPSFSGMLGAYDASPWSLPSCQHGDASFSARDDANPTEAILLSPDPDDDGHIDDGLNQIEAGVWTIRVRAKAGGLGANSAQRYAVAIVGGICTDSSVQLDNSRYACNASSSFVID